jgi:hypothetical protein
LRDDQARTVWTQDGITPSATGAGGAAVLSLPATVLQPGEYEVVLLAAAGPGQPEEVARYYFAVVRE